MDGGDGDLGSAYLLVMLNVTLLERLRSVSQLAPPSNLSVSDSHKRPLVGLLLSPCWMLLLLDRSDDLRLGACRPSTAASEDDLLPLTAAVLSSLCRRLPAVEEVRWLAPPSNRSVSDPHRRPPLGLLLSPLLGGVLLVLDRSDDLRLGAYRPSTTISEDALLPLVAAVEEFVTSDALLVSSADFSAYRL